VRSGKQRRSIRAKSTKLPPPARSIRTKRIPTCSSFLQRFRVEWEDREQVSHRIVDDDLLPGRREYVTHRFEIKSGARDFRCLDIFSEYGVKRCDVALRFVHTLEAIAFGCPNHLIGLPPCSRHCFVVIAVSDVDRIFAV